MKKFFEAKPSLNLIMSSGSINIHSPLARPIRTIIRRVPLAYQLHRNVTLCCAAQEPTTTATVTEAKKAAEPVKAAAAVAKPAVKPKKAPVKPLPEMMEEDVIPALNKILESKDDISQIELSFSDNRLEGSFIKKDIPYYFWAIFPDGVITGPKGFSLSSHGSEASTVEPFLVDERKVTDKLLVFWVEKRLAAQGILPVWKE